MRSTYAVEHSLIICKLIVTTSFRMDHIAQMILMKSERINVDFPITDSARM